MHFYYSLSVVPNEYTYRISVKRVPGGLISNYLHDHLNVGDEIEAMIPTGLFTLNTENKAKPVVLLSGGIGITPLLSMLYYGCDKFDEIHFVQATQNSKLHPFKNDLEKISERDNVENTVFYSNPLEKDIEGQDYDFKGYVNKEWILNSLPLNADFYFCGPPPFIKGINKALKELGVPADSIHYEFFGNSQNLDD